tara:strand:+ start:1589 stop:1960 length:372 start_codon:yes stop_codon:yes gene_type:complete
MHGLAAADELAMVRAHLAQLRKRELALKAQVLDAPPEDRDGRWHRIELVERCVRVFDHRLLPPQWRDDPLFWRDKTITQLRCVPLRARRPTPAPRPTPGPMPLSDRAAATAAPRVIEGRAVRL